MPDPSPLQEVVWRVRPLAAPQVLRHCAACVRTRAFAPTDAFRVNAQRRRLDVWLLYRCCACDDTWKRPLLRRAPCDAITPALLAGFLRNDPQAAWQAACTPDPELAMLATDAVTVERPPLAGASLRVRLTVPWPCGARLDRVLAAELGCSRDELLRRVRAGLVVVEPGGKRALRRPPRDGTLLLLSGALDRAR